VSDLVYNFFCELVQQWGCATEMKFGTRVLVPWDEDYAGTSNTRIDCPIGNTVSDGT